MKFFKIRCTRGHMGTGRTVDITFAIAAHNLLEAQDKAKRMPSVKHSRGILYGKEITYTEYMEFRKVSAYDRMNGFSR